jgi:hypothetical protein
MTIIVIDCTRQAIPNLVSHLDGLRRNIHGESDIHVVTQGKAAWAIGWVIANSPTYNDGVIWLKKNILNDNRPYNTETWEALYASVISLPALHQDMVHHRIIHNGSIVRLNKDTIAEYLLGSAIDIPLLDFTSLRVKDNENVFVIQQPHHSYDASRRAACITKFINTCNTTSRIASHILDPYISCNQSKWIARHIGNTTTTS